MSEQSDLLKDADAAFYGNTAAPSPTPKPTPKPKKYAKGTDTVAAELTPREAVLNRNAAELLGRHHIAMLNAHGNMLASKGIDLAARAPTGYQQGTNEVHPLTPRPNPKPTPEPEGIDKEQKPAPWEWKRDYLNYIWAQAHQNSSNPLMAQHGNQDIPGYELPPDWQDAQKEIDKQFQYEHIKQWYKQQTGEDFDTAPVPRPQPEYWKYPLVQNRANPLYAYRGTASVTIPKAKIAKFKPPAPDSFYATPKPLTEPLIRLGHIKNPMHYDRGTEDVHEGQGASLSEALLRSARQQISPQELEEFRAEQERESERRRAAMMNEKPTFLFQYGSEDVNDSYKQQIIDRILRGEYDRTYGPGAPGATKADMRQKIGAYDNPLKTGNVALPPSDYKLFTPEERIKYGIADKSYISTGRPNQAGIIERYFGSEAAPTTVAMTARGGFQPVPTSPTSGYLAGGQPYVPGGATQTPTTWTNYAGVGQVPNAIAVNQPSEFEQNLATGAGAAGKAIGQAFQQAGQRQQQSAMQGMAEARGNVPTSNPLLQQLAANPLEFLRQAASNPYGTPIGPFGIGG